MKAQAITGVSPSVSPPADSSEPRRGDLTFMAPAGLDVAGLVQRIEAELKNNLARLVGQPLAGWSVLPKIVRTHVEPSVRGLLPFDSHVAMAFELSRGNARYSVNVSGTQEQGKVSINVFPLGQHAGLDRFSRAAEDDLRNALVLLAQRAGAQPTG